MSVPLLNIELCHLRSLIYSLESVDSMVRSPLWVVSVSMHPKLIKMRQEFITAIGDESPMEISH